MISYTEALQILLANSAPLGSERVAAAESSGRVLAVAVTSPQSLPPFDNSAMDGFALCCAGAELPAGTELAVHGWQAAGDAAARATSDQGAWEIMTGARVPEGLDSMVPVEQVEILEQVDGRPHRIRLRTSVQTGQHLRLCGQDVRAGEQVLPAGATLGSHEQMLLFAIGVSEVEARIRPRVAVIATGKELVSEATQALASGQIRDSNRPYLVGRLQAAGAQVVWDGVVGDEPAAFDAAVDAALAAGAQLVVSTGAVSMGRYDFIPDALRARGAQILFHKVAIRPGKPLLFAQLPQGTLYFGLPGNPVSAAVGQRFFVEPVLRRLLGLAPEARLQLPLQADVRVPPGLRFHTRARVELDARGQLSVRVLTGQESFRLMSTLRANAWAVLDGEGDTVAAGTPVTIVGWGHRDPVQLAAQEMT